LGFDGPGGRQERDARDGGSDARAEGQTHCVQINAN
jgi:hypothetical protein